MTNVFMIKFKERLTKAMTLSAIIVLALLSIPALMGVGVISDLPSHMIPVVLTGMYIYGAGWYFSTAVLKKLWSRILNVGYSVSFRETLEDFGLMATIVCSVICFAAGCILAGTAGVYFMVSDFVLAKQGKPGATMKYRFGKNAEYIIWEKASIKNACKESDPMSIESVYTNEMTNISKSLAA